MRISYYAIFQNDSTPESILVTFPDVPYCFTGAYSSRSGIRMAKEALKLTLYGMDSNKLPKSSLPQDIKLKKGQKLQKISIIMEVKDGMLFDPRVVEQK